MKELFVSLNEIRLLSQELQNYLMRILICERFKKGQIIVRKGQVCRRIYFVESGITRNFYFAERKEINSWLQKEGDYVIVVKSFLSQLPAEESIQALEDCIVWSITYAQLEEVCRLFPEFVQHWKNIETVYYIKREERMVLFQAMGPKEKIEWFKKNEPELFKRIKQKKHIRNYLGVSRDYPMD